MDVVSVVTEIETVGDYGMQVNDVVETFHVQGKCVGCDHSNDSYCTKQKRWGYMITDCGKAVEKPKEKVVKHLSERTAHNAKPVKCSNGVTYQSLFLAAKAFKITPSYLRKIIQTNKDYAKFTFEFVEVQK